MMVPMLNRILRPFGLGRLSGKQLAALPLSESEARAAQTSCPPGWRFERATDLWGHTLGERWEFEEPPLRVDTQAWETLRIYIEKLILEESEHGSIIVECLQTDSAIHLFKFDGRLSTGTSFAPSSPKEAKARALGERLRLEPEYDYAMEDGTQNLSWLVPKNPAIAFEILRALAMEVEEMPDDGPLAFHVKEGRDDWPGSDRSKGISFRYTYPIEDPAAPPPVAS